MVECRRYTQSGSADSLRRGSVLEAIIQATNDLGTEHDRLTLDRMKPSNRSTTLMHGR